MNLRIHKALLASILLTAAALAPSTAFAQSDSAALEKVLTQMDDAARDFRSLEASFVWDHYTQLVDEHETSKGQIYFKRDGNQTTMAADIAGTPKQADAPAVAPKYILYSDGQVKIYNPKIDTVNLYKPGKNREAVESFLVLGFGGRGQDLRKSYDLKYLGSEKVEGVETAKLELVPKSETARRMFPRIVLWIDSRQGVSVQQQLFEQSGDYKFAKYTEIHLNQKLPDGVFKLKTTAKTTYVSTQG